VLFFVDSKKNLFTRFFPVREKPRREKQADTHKKHFAQNMTNRQERGICFCDAVTCPPEARAGGWDAVPDSLRFIGISLRSRCSSRFTSFHRDTEGSAFHKLNFASLKMQYFLEIFMIS